MESSHSCTMPTSSTSCPMLDVDQDEVRVEPQSSGPSTTTMKPRSIVWEHCTRFEKFHEKSKEMCPYGRCNYCLKEFPAHPTRNGTSSMKTHLTDKCVKSPIYEWGSNSKGQNTLTQATMGGPLVPHTFNQKKLEEKVYKWIIKDEQPFRAVEGEGFKEMIKEMCPKFKLPGRKKVAVGVLELFFEEKARIKSDW